MTVARRYAANIDMLGFALVRAMLDPVTSDPTGLGTGDAGRIWFRSDTPTLKVWSGTTAWDVFARANQTGTQTASTISDFSTAVNALRWESMTAPNAAVNMNSQQFSSLATATASGQAVEYAQFQTALTNVQAGLDFKAPPATVASATNISLSSPGTSLHGHTFAAGDTVLLTGQTTTTQNGIYTWNSSSSLTRRTDSSATGDIFAGTMISVGASDNTYGDTVWMQTTVGTGTNGTITIGTDALTWIQPFSSTTYTAGNAGISIVGTSISAVAQSGGGATISGSGIAADFTKVSQYVETIVPTASTGSWTISGAVGTYNHALGSYAPDVHIYVYTSPASGYTQGDEIEMYVNRTDSNNVQITFPAAPASNNWIVRINR
jgi:hypothetical protein